MPTDPQTQAAQEREKPLPPVAWLLGRQLIASMKWILLYTAFGTKLDARDWMEARVYPSDDQALADEQWKAMHTRVEGEQPPPSDTSKSGTDFWAGKEFWFDYLSDTGDGTTATYSIAYLCLNNLWMKQRWEHMPDPAEAGVQLECFKKEGDAYSERLPRGEFLMVGGDTSYHLSDYATLHLRFQNPFTWAYDDLSGDLKKVNKKIDDEASRANGGNRRPLFGIPGNHDYYDMLDGFRRQFRNPVSTRPENKVYAGNDLSGPQLMIPGFKREQNTSYVALRLPFGWMLWGLDTEVGKIDERQRDFFKGANGKTVPEKLIVATSAPTTVFGKLADRDDEKCSKAFFQLKLPRPFVTEKEEGEQTDLSPKQIRLDISGDVHQYARYWGPPNTTTNPRPIAKAQAPSSTNYASVVSGLGGAFHHPSTTYVDEIKEQALYPAESVSRNAVAPEIFNPWKVLKGGGVGVIGAAIALVLAFAGIANDSSRPAIHNFPPFIWLHVTQPERYRSTLVTSGQLNDTESSAAVRRGLVTGQTNGVADEQPKTVEPFALWRALGIAGPTWSPVVDASKLPPNTSLERCSDGRMLYLWGDCQVKWPLDYTIGMTMLLSTLLVIGLTFFLSERAYKLADKHEEVKEGASKPQEKEEVASKKNAEKVANRVLWSLWPTLGINVGLGIVGVLSIIPYRLFITPFGNSLWVLLTVAWGASSIIFSLRYSDWLFVQASKTTVSNKDWLITWALAVATLASLAVGLWLFGKNNLPAYLVADMIFVTVLLATLAGLIYVAMSMGGEHQKGLGKLAMGVLGFWHWILQLGVALFLLKKGTWLTLVLAVFVYFIFATVGKKFMMANYKWRLVGAWLAFGATMLALPPLVYWWLASLSQRYDLLRALLFWPHPFNSQDSFASYEWWGNFGGFWQLIPLALACFLGLALSCIWIGWYFAVCLRFNGHNNETGGAARIERYKQFIRFRLREDDLTGYVIAVDHPKTIGSELKDVKIVDIIHLKRAT
ncbi:MAG: AzlD domain-containing protein [Acidobacteriota bacterium]